MNNIIIFRVACKQPVDLPALNIPYSIPVLTIDQAILIDGNNGTAQGIINPDISKYTTMLITLEQYLVMTLLPSATACIHYLNSLLEENAPHSSVVLNPDIKE